MVLPFPTQTLNVLICHPTGQLYKITGSYDAAFLTGAGIMLVGIFLLYFVQRLRPELTTSRPWSGPTTEQQYIANLIAEPSIESLISGLDTLSGMCITKPVSINLSRDEIVLSPYRRFGQHRTESKTSHLGMEAHQSVAVRDLREITLTADVHVKSTSQECASFPVDTADPHSCSDSTVSVIPEVSVVPQASDIESVLSGSALSATGHIPLSDEALSLKVKLEEPDVRESALSGKPGIYDIRSNTSTDASLAGIPDEIKSSASETASAEISKEEEILVDVSSNETFPRVIASNVVVDIQSLVSSEGEDLQLVQLENKTPQTGSEIEMIKLPPPPGSTKQKPTPSLITLETSPIDAEIRSGKEYADKEILEFHVSSRRSSTIVVAVEDIEVQLREELEGCMDSLATAANGDFTQEIGQQMDALRANDVELQKSSEDSACCALYNTDDQQPDQPVPSSHELAHTNTLAEESDAYLENEGNHSAPSTPKTSVGDVEFIRLPPPPATPRTGTLVQLERLENELHTERTHSTIRDSSEFTKEPIDSTETDTALIRLEVSPKESITVLSTGLLSLEELDPFFTGYCIGVFHHNEPRSHTSISEPSQLSLLSQRLEAVAARQFEEEQAELLLSPKDSMSMALSSNQSAHSTPLFSANHSVPLTPMRTLTSCLTTPAPTAAQTPYSVPFSPVDVSVIQTPVGSCILHTPAEGRTVNSDFDLEFETSSHTSFTEDNGAGCCSDGSYSDTSNATQQIHQQYTGNSSIDNMDSTAVQLQSNSPSVHLASQVDTNDIGIVTGMVRQKPNLDLLSPEGEVQAPEPVQQGVSISTTPFLVETIEDSLEDDLHISQPPVQCMNTPAMIGRDQESAFKIISRKDPGEKNTETDLLASISSGEQSDVTSLFSNSAFQLSTFSEGWESSHPSEQAAHDERSDPWCVPAHSSQLLPDGPCIKLDPPPPTSRRRRTSSAPESKAQSGAESGQNSWTAHFPEDVCVEESREQLEEVSNANGGATTDHSLKGAGKGGERAAGQQVNREATQYEVQADRELFLSHSKQTPEVTYLADKRVDDVTSPIHDVTCADVEAQIDDALKSDNGIKPVDKVPIHHDVTNTSKHDVTILSDDVITQDNDCVLMQSDVSNQSEHYVKMQSNDYVTIQPSDSMRQSKAFPDIRSQLDDITTQSTEPPHDDDTAPLLYEKGEEFCFVTLEESGALEWKKSRLSSASSAATDESSSTDTSLSENEMPFQKLQDESDLSDPEHAQ